MISIHTINSMLDENIKILNEMRESRASFVNQIREIDSVTKQVEHRINELLILKNIAEGCEEHERDTQYCEQKNE